MSEILNAAPMTIQLGTEDRSRGVNPLGPDQMPQHIPLYYVFAAKGPLGRTYVDFDKMSLTQLLGDDTFKVNGKYFQHTTLFLQDAAAAGNNCVVHRLNAPDAKDVANVALYLDVLPVTMPAYQKNSDGSIKVDTNGEPVLTLDSEGNPINVTGYKVGWVAESQDDNEIGEYQRGLLGVRNGVQVDGQGNQSTQYPIFEFSAQYQGEDGNKLAVRMWPALQSDLQPFPDYMLRDGKQYPYNFGMVRLMDEITGTVNTVLNSFGAGHTAFTAKDKGENPFTGEVMDLSKSVTDKYIDLSVDLASGLGSAYTYAGNLDTVLRMFYDAEKVVSDIHRDPEVNNLEDNIYAMNILTFTNSNGSPYSAIRQEDFIGSIRINKNTNIFLNGSSDGNVDAALLDLLVAADMENYNTTLHEYNDIVMNPESMIYDSGFSLDTKKSLAKMIAHRKDTFVVLSTYAHDMPNHSLDQQYSLAIALKTYLELYPESATFGTGVARGMVVGGSGTLMDSLWSQKVPLTFEVASKAARYMGAKNGRWTPGRRFDHAPGSVLTRIKNPDVTWVPTSTRNVIWKVGLNFVLNYSKARNQQFFPALQTIYEDDTSVLNSFFTMVAISYLNKVLHAVWREYTGSISYTRSQFEERVTNKIKELAPAEIFDNLFVINPKVNITSEDAQRNYSWTAVIDIAAPGIKTVQTSWVRSFRIEDYEG